MEKVVLTFGTRPEAIKMAPVCLELARRPDECQPLVWVTGQHKEMLDQAMAAFGVKSDRDFGIMTEGQTLTGVTVRGLEAMGEALASERPDCVLVQGDTTTAFAAALAAFYAGVPVGHVEAGLRTWDKQSPFPEEINRQLLTRLSDYHFAPTTKAQQNILAEGIPEDRIWVTGNTVIDALDLVVNGTRTNRPELPDGFPAASIGQGKRLVLITGHRRESFGDGFESICSAIAILAREHADCEFVYPVHLNPNVRDPVHRILSGYTNIHLVEPLDYKAFIWAMDNCFFLLSDSGGVQEEAPHLGKPVLVMRDTTERTEAIDAGTCVLVGTDVDTIVGNAARLMDDPAAYAAMSTAKNPFGDGKAAVRIADALLSR